MHHRQRPQQQQPNTQMQTLSIGTVVMIKGLKKGTQYNEKYGTVTDSIIVTSGRYPIKLMFQEKPIAVRITNLHPATDMKIIKFEPGDQGFTCKGNKISKIIGNSQAEKNGVSIGWSLVNINDVIFPLGESEVKKNLDNFKCNNSPYHILFNTNIKPKRIPGMKADEVAQMISSNSAPTYLTGLEYEAQVQDTVKALGTENISDLVWQRMMRVLDRSMKAQLTPSLFRFIPHIHRFPDIYPYDFNAMPEYIGSWMGDCFGLMQWPLPGSSYNKVLQQIITENDISIIIALGKQEKRQRIEMVSYWNTLGKLSSEKQTGHCIIREITDIPPKNTSCTQYQFPQWPDRGSPMAHSDIFEFLFEKIRAVEESGKKVLVHCRAGVGRSGTLRLMYKVWMNQLRTDGLVAAVVAQRALRKYAVQTKVQYNFLQDYIRTFEKKKSSIKSFSDVGKDALQCGDYLQAAYWFFMYQSYGLGKRYDKLRDVIKKCPPGFEDFLRLNLKNRELPVNGTWETVQKRWENQQ